MATRFGAVSPAQAYATKVRWVVGALAVIIGVLVFLLVVLLQNSSGTQTPAPQAASTQATETPSSQYMVNILVAKQRIEEGMRLEAHLFDTQQVPTDRVPDGYIPASDRALIIGKFATHLINANLPIVSTDLSEQPPLSAIHIPPGFRAVTITVDSRSGVEGWARPNSRVDVLFTYTDKDARKKVATIVRFSKVLSVAGNMNVEGGRAQVGGNMTTVTLLVSEQDAKKIELARNLGTLSLSLVGFEEEAKVSDKPDIISIKDIVGGPRSDDKTHEEPSDGVMYTTDPRTGKRVRYELRHGRWRVAKQQDR